MAACLILLGTLYPLFLDALDLGKISVGPPYFESVFLVPMLPLLLLLAVGMHAAWKKAKLEDMKRPLLLLFSAALAFGVLVPILAYGSFHFMTSLGLTAGVWVILSSLYEPVAAAAPPPVAVARRGRHDDCPHWPRPFCDRRDRHPVLQDREGHCAGSRTERRDARIRFQVRELARGARSQLPGNRGEVLVSRDGKPVATLHPQKRTYRVQRSPMTEAGIEVDWNRDLFVAMGEDLGNGTWSMRVQYKPMVRFIWLGALVMAIGGFIAITDRRYRSRREAATAPVAAGAAPAR